MRPTWGRIFGCRASDGRPLHQHETARCRTMRCSAIEVTMRSQSWTRFLPENKSRRRPIRRGCWRQFLVVKARTPWRQALQTLSRAVVPSQDGWPAYEFLVLRSFPMAPERSRRRRVSPVSGFPQRDGGNHYENLVRQPNCSGG
jgi:hypothetical protein